MGILDIFNRYNKTNKKEDNIKDICEVVEAVKQLNEIKSNLIKFYNLNNINYYPIVDEDYFSAYTTEIMVYAPIYEIAHKISTLDWNIYRDMTTGRKKDITKLSNFDILRTPSKRMQLTFQEWIEQFIIMWLLSGESFNILTTVRGKIKEIIPVRSDDVDVIPDQTEYIRGYVWQSAYGGQNIPKEQMLFFKDYNPNSNNQLRGVSPLGVIARQINTAGYMDQWIESLIKNQGLMNYVFTSPDLLTKRAFDNLKAKYKKLRDNFQSGDDPIVLEKGNSVERVNISPKEAGSEAIDKKVARAVSMTFNYPMIFLGYNDQKYANAGEARKGFILDSIIPKAKKIAMFLNENLMPRLYKGAYFEWNFEKILPAKADYETRVKIAERAYLNNAITLNQYREAIGLPPIKQGDIFSIEQRQRLSLPQANTKTYKSKSYKNKLYTEQRKHETWKKFVDNVKALEDSIESKWRGLFDNQFSKVENTIDFTIFEQEDFDFDEWFDDFKNSDLFDEFIVGYEVLSQDTLESIVKEALVFSREVIGYDVLNLTDSALQDYISERLEFLVDEISETTVNNIGTAIQKGIESQETEIQLADRVQRELEKAKINLSKNRSKLIARTEAAAGNNRILWENFIADDKIWGKIWITQRDTNVRTEHQKMEGITLAKDVPFELLQNGVTVSWQYPQDFNERCTMMPVYEEDRENV
jgi:HK97 family phage portal protein